MATLDSGLFQYTIPSLRVSAKSNPAVVHTHSLPWQHFQSSSRHLCLSKRIAGESCKPILVLRQESIQSHAHVCERGNWNFDYILEQNSDDLWEAEREREALFYMKNISTYKRKEKVIKKKGGNRNWSLAKKFPKEIKINVRHFCKTEPIRRKLFSNCVKRSKIPSKHLLNI